MSIFAQSRTRLAPFSAAMAMAVALALPIAAQAADASKEASTAADHAGYAASADTVAKVHLHLHHVINCLAGPEDDAFDAKAGNPCDGQGNGALNDAGSDMADRKAAMKDALALAETGTEIQSLDAAQSVATTVKNLLTNSG